MRNILEVKNVGDYIRYLGGTEQHRLVGVVDYDELSPIRHSLNNYGVYGVFMHEHLSVDLTYGCGKYDYRDGTLICVAPGQIGGKADNGESIQLDGWALLFHPDFLHGTHLEREIGNYNFFNYNVNEALHTSAEEHKILVAIMKRIKAELQSPTDGVQESIVIDYISLMLNYCKRFYDRQFLTRKIETVDVLNRFRALLDQYYESKEQLKHGIPTVSYCADRLCMSAGYFGDFVKRFTGESAIAYIHRFLIQKAKNALSAGDMVANVAYDLGFDYPQHFSRMFKRREGITPSEYLAAIKR